MTRACWRLQLYKKEEKNCLVNVFYLIKDQVFEYFAIVNLFLLRKQILHDLFWYTVGVDIRVLLILYFYVWTHFFWLFGMLLANESISKCRKRTHIDNFRICHFLSKRNQFLSFEKEIAKLELPWQFLSVCFLGFYVISCYI